MSSSETLSRGPFAIPASAVAPDAAAVLKAQGASGPARPKVAAAAAEALALLARLAAPVAVVRGVSPAEFGEVFTGEGLNETPNPLESVFASAERLALFAVTLGRPVCGEIDRLFSVNDFALGCLLDSAASLAADRAAAWVEAECHRLWTAAGGAPVPNARGAMAQAPETWGPGLRSLRYSPGYCGWHITGQKKLLALLDPGRIGLALSETCLMSPLKSVSGVVVAAHPSRHAFEPGFAFCAACKPKSCRERKETRT